LGRSLAMPTLCIPQKKIIYAYHTVYFTLCALVFPRFSIGVLGGGCEPPILGKGRPRGPGMVPLERALVNFYRPSIVTFPLPLRVSEILSLLFSGMPLFPYPTSCLPQIFPCSPGCRWIAFWLQGANGLG